MVTKYWSVDTLFWQLSIEYNMDIQYQRRTLKTQAACLCQPLVGLWPPSCATPLSLQSSVRTVSHDQREKINSWVSFDMSMGPRLAVFGTSARNSLNSFDPSSWKN